MSGRHLSYLTVVYGRPGGNLWLPIWTLSNDIIGGPPKGGRKCNKETFGAAINLRFFVQATTLQPIGRAEWQLPVASCQLPAATNSGIRMLPQIIATLAGSRFQVESCWSGSPGNLLELQLHHLLRIEFKGLSEQPSWWPDAKMCPPPHQLLDRSSFCTVLGAWINISLLSACQTSQTWTFLPHLQLQLPLCCTCLIRSLAGWPGAPIFHFPRCISGQ